MITLSLNEIRVHSPCKSGWETLLKSKPKADWNEQFPLSDIIDSNGLDDALWCLRVRPEHSKLWRKYAVWCARQVEHLMTDERSKDALNIAWRHSEGVATDQELAAARDAARHGARHGAGYVAWDAVANSAWAAGYVAWVAIANAAERAAWDAAMDAADAARDAEGDDAAYAALAAQENKLREILKAGEWA